MSGYPYSSKRIVRCKDTGEIITGDKYLNSMHWKNMREHIINERHNQCERCFTPLTYQTVVIHHVTYKRFGNEKDSDLVLLCNRCHKIIHNNKKAVHKSNKNIYALLGQLTANEKEKLIEYAKRLIESR